MACASNPSPSARDSSAVQQLSSHRWYTGLPRWTGAVLAAGVAAVVAPCMAAVAADEPIVEIATGPTLDTVISGRRCSGLTAVLYSRLPSEMLLDTLRGQMALVEYGGEHPDEIKKEMKVSESAFEGFKQSAAEMQGMACYHALSCLEWPQACLDQNLRRTPSIVLYPLEGHAAQPIAGRPDQMNQKTISAAVQQLSGSNRTKMVSVDNVQAFLRDQDKPLKAILVSHRKPVPMIWQVLSADPELWPHVLFGFAKDTDTALKRFLGVTQVPCVVLQLGTNASTRALLEGIDATAGSPIGIVRSWLHRRVMQQVLDLDEHWDEYVATLELELYQQAKEEQEKMRVQRQGAVQYQKLPPGTNECPRGLDITSTQECELAIRSLGLEPSPPWVATYPGVPRFCSYREKASDSAAERMHFNSAPEGHGREDLSPICKVSAQSQAAAKPEPQAAKPVGGVATTQTQPASSVSKSILRQPAELLEITKQEAEVLMQGLVDYSQSNVVMGVFFAPARLRPEDKSMLEEIASRYHPRFQEQGTPFLWRWINAAMIPKSRDVFQLQKLPSFIILKPRPRPRPHRFYGLKHREGPRGEPLPVSKDDIENVLDLVLAAKARFQMTSIQEGLETPPTPSEKKKQREEAWKSQNYEVLAKGEAGCVRGKEIKTLEECEFALVKLGMNPQPKWVSAFPGLPRWCSVREQTTTGNTERLHFNTAESGQGRSDLAPVCKASGDGGGEVSKSSRILVPELTGLTHQNLFGRSGLCFVYLTDGPISTTESEMVVSIAQQFEAEIQERGHVMRWMWLDMRAERRMKVAFDPPALPSALVLNPHGKPGFVLATHEDGEDDALPIQEAGITLLLNTVLGGDAQFTPMPLAKLNAWAERGGSSGGSGV